jgi:hypothetical protein
VVSRRKPRLCARFVGYLPSFELGGLGRQVATLYNRALAIPEVSGGYGEAVLLGLRPYSNIYLEEHHDKVTGEEFSRLGWRTTTVSRNTLVGALQRVIAEDSIEVCSLEAIDSLMAVTVGPDGRIAAMSGRHDEDMVGLGIAAHLLETEPVPRLAGPPASYAPSLADIVAREMGTRPQRPGSESQPLERWR